MEFETYGIKNQEVLLIGYLANQLRKYAINKTSWLVMTRVQAIPNVLILVYVPVRMDTKEPNVMLIAVVIP